MKIAGIIAVGVAAVVAVPALAERPSNLSETPSLMTVVKEGKLPPVHQRIPESPSVVKLSAKDLAFGKPGGTLNIMMGRAKDVRQMVVYGYARLVGYDTKYQFVPDLLEKMEVKEGRIFTLHLRKGHRWSDGHPFTAEDFRYWWEDMATDKDISKVGPPALMVVDGKPAKFEVLNETTVRYSWDKPNPDFLPRLAGAAPQFIYRPAHYLKQFHAKYQDAAKLEEMRKERRRRSWVVLHFGQDRPYKNDNPDMPSLQPWKLKTKPPAKRFIFERNPYYHRVDAKGRQLPYLDKVIVTVASAKLIPAKAGAGVSDLQARGISLKNAPFLKRAEKRNNYKLRLWPTAKGSQMALFPNLNHNDPEWRKLFRDVRFRRALSMAVDRAQINKLIYLGLAAPVGNSVLKESPLYKDKYAKRWANFDPAKANKLLDEIGLTKRDKNGTRLLSDGRPLEISIETAGEELEQTDILQLIFEFWNKIGVKIFIKPSQREVLRNRVFSGETQMSVWFGLENGIPSADSNPTGLAPTSQQHLQWPKWGQHFETGGKSGQQIDLPEAQQLFDLNKAWAAADSASDKAALWHKMLDIYTDQVFTIGVVSRVPQPILVRSNLRNVPSKAIYNWDPGAHFGIYRPDTFWFDG